jgi:hypothetical protein
MGSSQQNLKKLQVPQNRTRWSVEDAPKTSSLLFPSSSHHYARDYVQDIMLEHVEDLASPSRRPPHLLAPVAVSPRKDLKMYQSDTESESSSSATSAADESRSGKKKAVSFGLVHIREYNRVVGDNPSVCSGPPVSIGWDFVQKQASPVDVYESITRKRKFCKGHSFESGLPRVEEDLLMISIDRRRMLRYGFGVSSAEIRAAEEQVRKTRKQRLQTMRQGKVGRAIENTMQSAKRIVKRIVKRILKRMPIRRKV